MLLSVLNGKVSKDVVFHFSPDSEQFSGIKMSFFLPVTPIPKDRKQSSDL